MDSYKYLHGHHLYYHWILNLSTVRVKKGTEVTLPAKLITLESELLQSYFSINFNTNTELLQSYFSVTFKLLTL